MHIYVCPCVISVAYHNQGEKKRHLIVCMQQEYNNTKTNT